MRKIKQRALTYKVPIKTTVEQLDSPVPVVALGTISPEIKLLASCFTVGWFVNYFLKLLIETNDNFSVFKTNSWFEQC